MASKRAVQFLAPRGQSLCLRARCTSAPASRVLDRSRCIASRAFSSIQYRPSQPWVGLGAAQKRWHSGIPEEQRSKAYQFDDVQRLISSPSDTTVLIDVREPSEYFANSIPTAINIPVTSQPDALLLSEEEFEDRFGFQKPPVEKEVVFFCKAGVRSAAAAQLAKQAGYQKVGEYRGSFLDWERKGGPGTKSPPPPGGKPEPMDKEVKE